MSEERERPGSGVEGKGFDGARRRFRSEAWFNNPDNIDMTALYLERYLNYGISASEFRSGKPVIGIAQTGSDLSPCNRQHLQLATRVKEGVREAGGIPLEFPVHPIQETGRRPTAAIDRNLAWMGLVEVLHGYPLDAVVLTIGCDKTTPACLMAAATTNLPSIALSVGPMLNGWHNGERAGSGTIIWRARQLLAAQEIDEAEFLKMVSSSAPSTGVCSTMGTANTMNSLAEALGMSLPGGAVIPAPHRDRQEIAYLTGKRIVAMAFEDLRPAAIMTRDAFLNAIVLNSAIGGSTNAPIHMAAMARHMGVQLDIQDWEDAGLEVPLMVNCQPAGKYLGEDFHRAGGVPAVMGELLRAGLLRGDALTCTGRTIADEYAGARIGDPDVIRPFDQPLRPHGGFKVMRSNIFDSAVMKLSVIDDAFRARYLSNPHDPDAFTARAVVFDGPEEYHRRIDDPALGIDADCILVIRGVGPVGYPGSAEVVNMRPPDYVIKQGIDALPTMGDGRQSGTSGSPSILNVSPEAAAGGGIALIESGDRIRVDVARGRCDLLVDDVELARRREALETAGGYQAPADQSPWQQLFRRTVGQMGTGAVMEEGVAFQRVIDKVPVPRDSH